MSKNTYKPKVEYNNREMFGNYEAISLGYYEEKKSKFHSLIFSISGETEVRDILSEVGKIYSDSSHIVYAYSIDDMHKYSDDGEPSGTAGKMVYSIMEKQKISNICIVVVRYFGGTLLGAGNLSRAYLKSAKDAIDKCDIKEYIPQIDICIQCGYNEEGIIRDIINSCDSTVNYVRRKENVEMGLLVPENKAILFQKWIKN